LKKIVIIICFFTSFSFSQEFNAKWSHALAGGATYCLDQHTGVGHDYNEIKYKNPGYVLFYRLINEKKDVMKCLTLNANYRSGSGISSKGGLGGSSTSSGTFDWCRLDAGFTILGKIGKEGDFSLGPGIYAGGIVYAKGSGEHIESVSGQSTSESKNPFQILNAAHLGFNIELQQKIGLDEYNALLLGLRIGLETPDGFNIGRFTKLASGYIGYQFARKKKAKPTETTPTDR
jgi:hypothetical protein